MNIANTSFPKFTNLDLSVYAQQLDTLLASHLQKIETILHADTNFTWDTLMQPLEAMGDSLERFWSPLSHLHAVKNSPELRACYQACLPKLAAYETAMGQNHVLYQAVRSLDRQGLNATQNKIIDDTLLNFHLSGVDLPAEKKSRFEAIVTRLSQLSNQFENNVLDAVQVFRLHITDVKRLSGLPEHIILNARDLAEKENLSGWMLTLEFPCYSAVVTYADDRALRETFYHAYVTRASDQGPSAGQFDNTSIMNEMMGLRYELAQLLGFSNFAEYALVTRMAESPQRVNQFLQDLTDQAYDQAIDEFNALKDFARQQYQMMEIEPWDVAYLSEKKRQASYAMTQEELRPFFPLEKVVQGLLIILQRLYGMRLEDVTTSEQVDVWHEDVRCYRIFDEQNQTRGYIYMDLFARPSKRGGAWMDSLQSRWKRSDGTVQLPVATLTCNFAQPAQGEPATLLHEELETLFHELGHCLHHLLTRVDYLEASGIHGVEWDAVELPSQFFENWCWEASALELMSSHVKTAESLPKDLLNKLLASKNFQSAMVLMRQLEFARFDFKIHQDYQPQKENFIADTLAEIRAQVSVVPIAAYNRFQHSFTHIFGGGYAAGYYSYTWAEVLSSDAFSRFEQEGIFNSKTGRDFLHCILEVGSSCKASEAFMAFRGRKPNIDALLRHRGIKSLSCK